MFCVRAYLSFSLCVYFSDEEKFCKHTKKNNLHIHHIVFIVFSLILFCSMFRPIVKSKESASKCFLAQSTQPFQIDFEKLDQIYVGTTIFRLHFLSSLRKMKSCFNYLIKKKRREGEGEIILS